MMKQIKVTCDYCNKDFLLTAVLDIKVDVLGKEMVLQYFVCPSCKKVHKVCLKDHGYDVLKLDLDRAVMRYTRAINGSGLNSTDELTRLLNIVKRKQGHLAKHVEVTNNRYPGTFTFASKNNEDAIIYHENHGKERK